MGAVPLLLYSAFWLALFAAYVVLFVSVGATAGQALRNAFASLLPPALLGLLVRQVARAVPWPDRFTLRFFAVQALLAPAYAFACSLLWRGLVMLDQLITLGKLGPPILASIVAFQSLMYTVCYVGLAAASYAQANAARVRRADSLRAQAELQLLRSQLNPHFILNTLHALIGLVRRQPDLAERAIEQLGELLHYGLRLHKDGVDRVPLREEWAFVQSYLEIEQLRLGERLRVSLKADATALELSLPPFSLQPLVENAVHHAIAPRAAGGRLLVSAARANGRLLLEVTDDGPGLGTEASKGAGLGLRLLRERLAALYGDTARLALEPSPDGGVRARLDLPAQDSR
jgi:signal transduction histidine kinase